MKVESPAQQLFFTTVRIEASGPNWSTTGTAFLFTYRLVGGQSAPFLVTNKHIVTGSERGRFFFTRQLADGGPDIGNGRHVEMDDFEKRWFGHPKQEVDVCVMPLAPVLQELSERVFIRPIPRELAPNQDQLEDLDAIEEVLFVGYPSGIFDRKNLIPVARRGVTATPIQLDYEGLPAFLVDGSVFRGSSGSPVFLVNTNGYRQGHTYMMGETRVYFLGVIAQAHLRKQVGKWDLVTIPTSNVPVVTSEEMLDLGVVFRASTVIETVEALLWQLGLIRPDGTQVGSVPELPPQKVTTQ